MSGKLKKFKELPKKDKIKRVSGLCLMIIGIVIVLSVIMVPIINSNHNKKEVAAIKDNLNVNDETNSLSDAVENTGVSAEVSDVSVTMSPEEESSQRKAALLQESSCIGVISIEKIGVELAIEEGSDDETLKHAVGHMSESAALGQKGNCVLAGHHGGYYGEFFLNIDKLENGDMIEIIDKNGNTYYYSVYDKKVVKRTDWSVVDELNEQSTITLITCVDSTQEERIIVSAIKFQ